MLARLVGVASIVAMLMVGLLAGAAMAVEEGGGGHGPLPELEEVGSQSEISREYFPEPAEEPVFAPFLVWPLLALGIVVVLAVLVLYLKWQPGFEEQRKAASSGRRR